MHFFPSNEPIVIFQDFPLGYRPHSFVQSLPDPEVVYLMRPFVGHRKRFNHVLARGGELMGPFKGLSDEDNEVELRAEVGALDVDNVRLREEIAVLEAEESKASDMLVIERDDLQDRVDNAYEIFAGMEGFARQTTGEKYLYNVIRLMAHELKDA